MTSSRAVATVVLGGVVGGIGIEIFGMPGLSVASALLLLAIAIRQPLIAAIVAIADGLALTAWTLAVTRCEPTLGRTCELDGGLLALFTWAGALIILGIVATLAGAKLRQHAP